MSQARSPGELVRRGRTYENGISLGQDVAFERVQTVDLRPGSVCLVLS